MSFHGFAPERFIPKRSPLRDFGQILSGAIAKIPELKAVQENKVDNAKVFELLQEKINDPATFPDEAFTRAGTSREQVLRLVQPTGRGTENNIEYAARVQGVLGPITAQQAQVGRQRQIGGAVSAATTAVPIPGQFEEIPGAGTQAEIATQVGREIPGVTTEELKRVPAFATAPTQEDILQRQLRETQIGETEAKTEAAKALTRQRTSSALLNDLKANPARVRKLDDIQLTKAEVAARVALSKIPKFTSDEFGNETSEINEDYVNMQILANDIRDEKAAKRGAAKVESPTPQAIRLAASVKAKLPETIPEAEIAQFGGEEAARRQRLAVSIVEQARQMGIGLEIERVLGTLQQASLEEIMQLLISKSKKAKGAQS